MSVNKVVLKSNDDQVFEVASEIAQMSVTLKHMLEDLATSPDVLAPIPLPNVAGKVLSKVIEYCVYHHEHPLAENEKKNDPILPWDTTFCQVDLPTLFEIILASNYLDIDPLLVLTCKTIANMIKGKTPEEIRKIFNITNDLSPEEEEQIRKENDWCENP